MKTLVRGKVADLGSKLQLHFLDEGNWQQFPEWANYFVRLGAAISNICSQQPRLVVGVSVPTRAFVAPLIASGLVLQQGIHSSGNLDQESHFHNLCKFVGHPVTYNWEGKHCKGIIVGCETIQGQRLIKVQIQHKESGGGTIGVKLQNVHDITLLAESFGDLPKRRSGKQVAAPAVLITSLLNVQQAHQFVLNTQLECVLIGRLNVLRHEITTQVLANQLKYGTFGEGILNDCLRVRSTSNPTQPYRSVLRSAQSRKSPRFTPGKVPSVAIFDGANGFLKWRENFQNSHWVVVLDRTDSATQDASTTLNNEYILKRLEQSPVFSLGPLPPGIEIMAYNVQRMSTDSALKDRA